MSSAGPWTRPANEHFSTQPWEVTMKQQKPKHNRRAFLAGAVTAGGAAAVLATGAEAAVETAAQTARDPVRSSGYQETDHVRSYYNTARI